MRTIEAIPAQTIKSIAMVGNVVTFEGRQYKVHSVEGYDYYAFLSGTDHQSVTCDFSMTPSEFSRQPLVYLLPMGCKLGEDFGFEVRLHKVTKGVSLAKM